MSFIVAIDGPTSSGKTTIAQRLAEKMNFVNIQTGAMYRCIALKLLRNGIELNDKISINKVLTDTKINLIKCSAGQIVLLDGENVTDIIRTKEITDFTSNVASNDDVRKILVEKQRNLSIGKNVIIEGRDTGTNVFPNADVKFYVTASPDIRARRRFYDLIKSGEQVEYIDVLQSMYKWDQDAMERNTGALKRADDSIYIDTSEKTVEKLEEEMASIIYKIKKTKERESIWEK